MPGALAWAGLLAAAFVGSTIGGVAGFGAGVILLPTLVWAVGVKATIPTLTVAMALGNLSRVWWSRRELVWPVVGAYLVGAVPAVAVGAVTYAGVRAEWLSRIIGGFLLASVPLRRWLMGRDVRVRLVHNRDVSRTAARPDPGICGIAVIAEQADGFPFLGYGEPDPHRFGQP